MPNRNSTVQMCDPALAGQAQGTMKVTIQLSKKKFKE